MSSDMLLHICCAPCATAVLEALREQGHSVRGYFYNPSIHPWKELQRRLSTLLNWAPAADLPLDVVHEYPLEENISMLITAPNRCGACFMDRMRTTALKASELGIGRFTTTLTVSPYQNGELIREAGERASSETGVEYVHHDFTSLYRRSISLSRELGMYRQPYCGCVFSERDRYLDILSPGQKGPQ